MGEEIDANLKDSIEGQRTGAPDLRAAVDALAEERPGENRIPREYPLIPAMAVVKTPYFHVVGYSVAGEESVIQLPELNVNFDIGKCPRPALTADYCLLTHGHIDHSAGIPYYLSQRFFAGG